MALSQDSYKSVPISIVASISGSTNSVTLVCAALYTASFLPRKVLLNLS